MRMSLGCSIALAWILGHAEGVPTKNRRLARSEHAALDVEGNIIEAGATSPATRTSASAFSCKVDDFAKSHDYIVSEEQLRRGEISSAGAFRLQNFLKKLNEGSDVSIAVLGGPVEFGAQCSDCTVLWHEYIRKWLKKTFSKLTREPSVDVIDSHNKTKLRSAFDFGNATQAAVLKTYDLIILAGVGSNYPLQAQGTAILAKGIDVNRHYAELLLRDLLRAPQSPAVMIVAWLHDHWWDTENSTEMQMHNGLAYRFGSLQDEVYEFLAMYYEISMMSARNALLHSTFVSTASDNLPPGWDFMDLLTDRLYPNPAGHNLFGQLIVNFLCKQLKYAHGLPPTKQRRKKMPPAIFTNATHLAALRRSTDFSGFPGNPDDAASLAVHGVNVTNTSNSSFSLEVRTCIIPFALLEAVCFAYEGGTRSALGFLYAGAAPVQQRQLHVSAAEPLRFLAAAQLVAFYEAVARPGMQFWHYAVFGQYWMQFLFVLTGFALYAAQGNAPEVLDPPGFLRKRFADWYPVYLVGAIVSLLGQERPLLSARQYVSDNALPGFSMTDTWAYPYGIGSPNGPAWFLSTLFFFWLCFPHWYSTIHALRTPWIAVGFAYLSSFLMPLAYSLRYLGSFGDSVDVFPHPSRFIGCHPVANWEAFIFGMGLARVASESHLEAVPIILRQSAASAALAALLVLPLLMPFPAPGVLRVLMHEGPCLLPLFGVLIVFAVAGEDKLLTPRFFESSRALWLGKISRPLLVLHAPFRMWISSYLVDPSLHVLLISQLWIAWVYAVAEQQVVAVGGSWKKCEAKQAATDTS